MAQADLGGLADRWRHGFGAPIASLGDGSIGFRGVRKIISARSTAGTSVPLPSPQYAGPAAFRGCNYHSASQLKAYSDRDPFTAGGGSAIMLNVFHTAASAGASCFATITGHTITP